MFEGYFTKYLKEGEEVISIERRYYLTFVFQAALALMLVLIPFFFLFPLFRLGGFGVLSFFALLLLGLVVLTRQGVMYYLNGLVITKERIMDFDQRGLFNRVVSETTYAKIQDVSFEIKGVLQTMLNYGNLEIKTAGAQAYLEINVVAEHKRILEMITRLQTE
ncbi:MAG: PH domain-containing protein, partial [bacterium]|nr:PH domain-containing protein [bacterium]